MNLWHPAKVDGSACASILNTAFLKKMLTEFARHSLGRIDHGLSKCRREFHGEAIFRPRYAERGNHIALMIANGGGDANDFAARLTVIDGVAALTHEIELAAQLRRLDDGLLGEALQRPVAHPVDFALRLEREECAPGRNAIGRRAAPDMDVGAHRVRAVDAVELDHLARRTILGKLRTLGTELDQLFEITMGDLRQLDRLRRHQTQLPQPVAEPIALTIGRSLHIPT